ncbi:hypothetical protein J5I95_15890 [Candidatus Poribacteria bacterium]|nr:hypothetical protein [Candidatus Poribacteria bacterium]
MKNKRKKRNFIKPVEETIILDEGFTNTDPYVLSAIFPEHKLVFVIDKSVPVEIVETGPNAIINRLKKMKYNVPEYLENMQRDIGVLWRSLNVTVYGRLTAEGHQIEPNRFRETPDFWLYHATDDEIRAITKDILEDANETLRDVALRFFLHFRHMAIDTMAGMQAEGDTDGTEIDPSTET